MGSSRVSGVLISDPQISKTGLIDGQRFSGLCYNCARIVFHACVESEMPPHRQQKASTSSCRLSVCSKNFFTHPENSVSRQFRLTDGVNCLTTSGLLTRTTVVDLSEEFTPSDC